ncbi:MAG: hypothetical protein HY298_17270 [Verrucomicrobia bacterium]|nr:hypothetical protein [Verrucomicrobiota bacterium]
MKTLGLVTLLTPLSSYLRAAVAYGQPHNGSGTLYQSSWWDPDGSDYDQYVWDGFSLATTQTITEIHWRGGFDPTHFGMGGPVIDFTVEIWSSITGGSQPDIGSVFAPNPLVHYQTGGNAGETSAGTFGSVAMYDYQFTLPTPFQAAAGTKYWVQIEAWQQGIPDWCLAASAGGDGQYFRQIAYVGDKYYQLVTGNAAFTLVAPDPPTLTITPTTTNAVLISWPTPSTGFQLQHINDLTVTNWASVTNAVTVVGTNNQVIVSPLTVSGFFRLIHF